MSEVMLDARRREAGRSVARALRRQGVVPGIFYFHGEEPIAVAATELALRPLIYTNESHIVRLRLDDGVEKTCVLKDVTFDPVTDRATHFDLQGIAMGEKIRVDVPVMLIGTAIGQREGGIVDHTLHKLSVECLPADLPEHVDVDVTNLKVGESIHVRDISVAKITILDAEDATIVTIAAPRLAVDLEPQTVVAAEPEVITKGKEDSED